MIQDLDIRWLGQGGYLLDDGITQLAIDPFCGEAKNNTRRLYPSTVEKGSVHVDSVIVTHPHWDHFDLQTYEEYVIPKEMIAPPSCIRLLETSHLAGNIKSAVIMRNEVFTRGAFTIRAVMADHDGDSMGVVIDYCGTRLYFTGDTLFTPRFLKNNCNLKPDILFVCINGKGDCLSLTEAALYARILEAKVAVPNHYDMISNNNEDPMQFVDELKLISPKTRGFVMERGIVYRVQKLMGN